MADTNKTMLKMLLQFRRDDVFTASYVLEKGEPGFEISTNTLKIGDGSTTWENLKIANYEAIDALIDSLITANNANYYSKTDINGITTELETALADEIDGVEGALTAAVNTINGTIATLATKAELETEAKTRGDADAALGLRIDGVITDLGTETSTRVSEVSRVEGLITAEAGTRADEITRVEGLITTAESNIRGDFASADTNLKTHLEGLLATEKTDREDADAVLDGRLDSIEGKLENVSNVMDFVGAGATLPAANESHKGDVFVINDGDNAGKEYVFDGTTWVEFGFATANENAIAALQDRMTEAEGDIDDLEAEFATGGRVTSLEGHMTTAEGNITSLTNRVSGAEERLGGHDNALDALEGRVEALEEAVELINDAEDGILKAAKDYADSLATNYDEAGAADAVKTELLGDATKDTASSNTIAGAKKYADSLAVNYDAAGSAATAKQEAINAVTGTADDTLDTLTLQGVKKYAADKAEAARDTADRAAEGYAASALQEAKNYTDAQLKAAAASVEAGTANDDIIVTPDTSTGKTTVEHKTYSTGTYTKAPESSSKTGDIYFFDSIATSNGHVTGGTMKSLASILEGMTFVFDGGKSTD